MVQGKNNRLVKCEETNVKTVVSFCGMVKEERFQILLCF